MKAAGIIVLLILAGAGLALLMNNPGTGKGEKQDTKNKDNVVGSSTELQKIDEIVGDGKEAKKGDSVEVHYTGTLANGNKFDSSHDRNTPYEFQIGISSVIQGWHLGVVGMKEGGRRKLIIPPDLAYGPRGRPPTIPPNAELHFVIELLKVR